ncbi:hypothetical protein CFP56_034487 [Quercus suber]|uniref:Uncharacterized protein n=1 Tax=Quercus suber TaxID=58331 RepID=A0AAW0LS50_QUESU
MRELCFTSQLSTTLLPQKVGMHGIIREKREKSHLQRWTAKDQGQACRNV